MDEEYEKYANEDVTITITFKNESVDIYCSVKDVLTDSKNLADDMPKILMEIIDDSLDSVTGMKREAQSEPEDSIPTKRQKTDLLSKLNAVIRVIRTWEPEKKYVNRVKGRIAYLGLLNAICKEVEDNCTDEIKDIVDRVITHWEPALSSTAESLSALFMKEVSLLFKECKSVKSLSSSVELLMKKFKNG